MDINKSERRTDLYVFDFDNTVIEENSDTCFYNLLNEDGILPQELSEKQREGQWTAFMQDTFNFLKQKNISVDQLKIELEKCHLVNGTKELFQKIKEIGGEIIICSDANTKFIDWIVKKNELEGLIDAIYTNPCTIKDNQLFIQRFYESHDCPLCIMTPNQCKARAIREHIALHAERKYGNVHFFGDGSNDFCPIKSLSNQNSTGFVRKGFNLERKINAYIQSRDYSPFKCKLVYWKYATELLPLI